MGPTRHFAAAPWPRSLRLTSALGTVLLIGVAIAAHRAAPGGGGFTHVFGVGIAWVPPLLLVASYLFTVTGYAVSAAGIAIQRPLWETQLRLDGLQRVTIDPAVCKDSVRLIGNAGLFGYTGLYRNGRLGTYRLFATDPARAVVLVIPRRTIVVTPASPAAFVEHLQHVFPHAQA